MIAISPSARLQEVEAGFKVLLTHLVLRTAELPDPIFKKRLDLLGGFTRNDFTNLYLKHFNGCPEPEFSVLFQSCINARYNSWA